ncbi:hypothetical protein H4R19_002392 [Coemansia spiralis]|nr:hypothetical protein H4R19_002392 [Coemansia spiralis]
MAGKDLSIGEFIMVVRELPLLESLTCGVKLDNGAGEIDANQVATLTETDAPLSNRFRRWIPIITRGNPHLNADQWNKILAGVCPNFDYRGTGRASDETASSAQTSEQTSEQMIDLSIYSPLW